MNRPLTFLVLLVVLVASGACRTQRQYDLTLLSTKNTDLASDADQARERVKGESCSTVTDVFSTGSRPMSVEGAIDDAIFQAGGDYDALVDGVILREDYFFKSCIVVEGTPAKARSAKARRRGAPRGDRPDKARKKKPDAEPDPVGAKAEPDDVDAAEVEREDVGEGDVDDDEGD